MTDASPKPLKILTLDGGGLQAISTLLILNQVLEAIAERNGSDRKPRPCDVFDTIVGIGAGGWLAILLGRFRMDITACLTEWYKIMQFIAPRSKSEQLRLRLLQHCYFDRERLVEQVDSLTKLYRTGDYLFEPDIGGARTRHVFVAALNSDGKSYDLFRSYEIPDSAKVPKSLLKGPEDPSKFKISSAFGVTGAARYFSMPWKEQMAGGGKISFNDTKFPKPHNITELALDEMWGIYGTDIPLSIVLNVGPGLPNDIDVKEVARRFSWGLKGNLTHETPSISPSEKVQGERKRSDARTDGFGSIKESGIDAKLRRLEEDIEDDIRKKLDHVQPGNSELYFRLALAESPRGTPQNDSAASGVVLDATMDYLSQPHVGNSVGKVAERLPEAPIERGEDEDHEHRGIHV